MKKAMQVLLTLFLSVGAFAECVNFAGRWTNVSCEYYGPFQGFEYTYPFIAITQTGCQSVDFGPGESVLQIGKSLILEDIPQELHATGTIEGKWLDASQQALEIIRDLTIEESQEKVKQIRTSQYKIEDGKLIMDITRNDSGYRWQNLSGARCTYSHRE